MTHLPPDVAARLEGELAAAAPPPAAVAPEAESAALDPSRVVAEFVLVARLGRGGTGEVWKAWDRSLGRWVAVKTLTAPPEWRNAWERFQREAQAAARLNHPNIVPVYRAAEHDGRPYLVMPLVEGRTLAGVRLSLPRALEAVRDAALAVHAAHERSVIHRDLKPGNVMLDAAGRVWVLDFGLARLLEGGRAITAPGTVLGTPAYMPPEQARGEAADARADTYSLGATLYELVTGRPPFDAATGVEVVRKVIDEEPPAPRRLNARLPRDVETVVMKAMAREPARRYATAADFAEDLRRVLAGEPIAARPASLGVRVARRLLRRPLAVALVLAMAAAAVLWRRGAAEAQRLEREREREAVRAAAEREAALAALRDTARSLVETALRLRRAGSNEGMAATLPSLAEAYRRTQERARELPEVDFWMARMHRAILDVDTALAFAGRALERDPEHAPALYERVVLLSMRHGHCLREDSEASRAEIVRLRAAILADCARLGGLDPTRELAARGLLAYHEGRFAEAEALLHRALGRDPHLEEAWETLALAASAQAWHAEGHEKGARWREAVDLFTKAIGQDRGYVPYWLGRATARLHRGAWADASGGDPSEDWAEAERDCAEALRLQPAWLEGRLTRGAVRSNRAARLARRGADPTGDWAGAEEDFGAILAAGEHATARMARAGTRMHRGVWRAQAGGDPVPDWAAAEEDYGTLEGAAAREARGNVRYNLAVHAERAGRDARAVWAAVAADYEEAIAIDPSRAGTLAERLAAARARR